MPGLSCIPPNNRGPSIVTESIINRLTGTPVSRRAFAITGLATGFALSVQPISAASITTDAAGLETGEAKIPVSDGEIPAYWAKPAKGAKLGPEEERQFNRLLGELRNASLPPKPRR